MCFVRAIEFFYLLTIFLETFFGVHINWLALVMSDVTDIKTRCENLEKK